MRSVSWFLRSGLSQCVHVVRVVPAAYLCTAMLGQSKVSRHFQRYRHTLRLFAGAYELVKPRPIYKLKCFQGHMWRQNKACVREAESFT